MHENPETMATLGGVRARAQTEEITRSMVAHWRAYGFGLWIAYEAESGRFAGRGGLKHADVDGQDMVEVAYGFMPEMWGRGLATELARECVRVAFEDLELADLACFTLTTNRASQHVMQKVGFRYKRDFMHAGMPHVLCRLSRKEWLTTAGAARRVE